MTPTKAQIDRAARAWLRDKNLQADHDDLLFFRTNWTVLPKLGRYVEEQMLREKAGPEEP